MIKNLTLPEVSKLGILVDTRRQNLKKNPGAAPPPLSPSLGRAYSAPQLEVSAATRPQRPRIRRSLSSNRLSMI